MAKILTEKNDKKMYSSEAERSTVVEKPVRGPVEDDVICLGSNESEEDVGAPQCN